MQMHVLYMFIHMYVLNKIKVHIPYNRYMLHMYVLIKVFGRGFTCLLEP